MNCEEVEELAGAYVLEALPPELMEAVEAHLASCQAHPEIAELKAVARGLAGTAPEKEPPPALKARIMGAIKQEMTGRERVAPWAAGRRGPWLRLALHPLIAVLALMVVGLLSWNIYLQLSGDGQPELTFIRSLSDSGTASGRLLYLKEEGQGITVLTVEGLPQLPADKTYQLWIISGGRPTWSGVFNTSESGEAWVAWEIDLSRVDLSQTEVAAITIEPAGGSPQPTTEPLLKAEI